jgi:hypothetical protein
MKRKNESGIGGRLESVLISAAVLYLLASMFGWLVQRKWGALLIIWGLWLSGAIILVGAALTAITGDYNLGDRLWPWIVYCVVAAVMTAAQWKECRK